MLPVRLTPCLLLSLVLGGSTALPAAEKSAERKPWCIVAEDKLDELSGLAPHRGGEETLLWAHNDGPSNKLYLLDNRGETRATLEIEGIDSKDCEELCSFEVGQRRFLLLADTGDNDQQRKSAKLYLLAEPDLAKFAEAAKDKQKKNQEKLPQFQQQPLATLEFTYPKGARNCEAVGVDPSNLTILLVTKEKNPGCEVFTLPLPLDSAGKLLELPAQPQMAMLIARAAVPTITGLAIDPDGTRLVLLGRSELFEFLRPTKPAANAAESWSSFFKQAPKVLAKPEQKQGEAICFGRAGKRLYLGSEKIRQPIWEMELKTER